MTLPSIHLAITPPGGAELWIILLIIVLLFGAKKLPDLARSVGQSMTEFRKGTQMGEDEDAERDRETDDRTPRERGRDQER